MEEEYSGASDTLSLSEAESPQPQQGSLPLISALPAVAIDTAVINLCAIAREEIMNGVGSMFSSVRGDPSGSKNKVDPRKSDADGDVRVPHVSTSSKRGRGRPLGSRNSQLLASSSDLFNSTAREDFMPHVMTVFTGEDIASKIISFLQKGSRGICVLSANGTVSSATIRQLTSSGGILTYQGCFEILSLTGSFTVSNKDGMRGRTGGLSVSLAGSDGHIIGGGVAGLLKAASPVQIVVGSFMSNGSKGKKKKYQNNLKVGSVDRRADIAAVPVPLPVPLPLPIHVPVPAPIPQAVDDTYPVIPVIPISHSVPCDNMLSSPTSHNNFMVQNHMDSAAVATNNSESNMNNCWDIGKNSTSSQKEASHDIN